MPRPTTAARQRAAHTTLPRRAATLLAAAALVSVAAVTGCEREEARSATDASKSIGARPSAANDAPAAVPMRMEASRARQAVAGGGEAAAAPSAESSVGVSQTDVGDALDRVAPDMVIRSGTASVQVDSLDVAVQRVRQLAQRVGGVIANSSLQSGRDQVRTATLEVKVAAARFDDLVTGLEPFGKVESVNVTAEEVGEEYVDVSARVANARRLEARLIDLLANRTGKLSDVLTVERELARVREEIERYEGRLRYLKSRSAVSTLAVTVHEPFPILAGQPATNPIAEALRQAWRNFVALTAAVIASLGVLVPLAALGALAWVAFRRVRRPRTGAGAAA